MLKSVYIYGSYRKNKTGVPFFEHPVGLVYFRLFHSIIHSVYCLV